MRQQLWFGAASLALASFVCLAGYELERQDAAVQLRKIADYEEGRQFHADLLRIAKDYQAWTRVSDEVNWAPADCRPPPPAGVQRSTSADGTTHGRKLYYLFAKNADCYRELSASQPFNPVANVMWNDADCGQALVKVSWIPVEVRPSEVPKSGDQLSEGRTIPINYVIERGHAYRTGEQSDLFIMYKLDPATPGTDRGWVYGTVSPYSRNVTAAGRVQSCMRCHDGDGTRDRLFGLQREPRTAAEQFSDQLNR